MRPGRIGVERHLPTEAALGNPIYPWTKFIDSYDAGRGQRYYLFGAAADFAQKVTVYRATLKQRVRGGGNSHVQGWLVRQETTAITEGVTLKDRKIGP